VWTSATPGDNLCVNVNTGGTWLSTLVYIESEAVKAKKKNRQVKASNITLEA